MPIESTEAADPHQLPQPTSAAHLDETNLAVQRSNARLGLVLFFVYLVMYGGFVLVSAFSADSLDWRPAGGLNLALIWGFTLIVAALVLAMVYGLMAQTEKEGDR